MTWKLKLIGVAIGGLVLAAIAVPVVLAAGTWSAPIGVTSNSLEDNDPALALHNGKAYVVFVRGEDRASEIYYRTNAAGSWGSAIRLTFNSTGDSAPDIAVDGAGNIHVVHLYGDPNSGGDNEVVYRTNRSGAWKRKILTQSPEFENNPAIALAGGTAHIVYGTEKGDADEIWYATNSTGSWQKTRITNNGYSVEGGSITQRGGVPHITYTNQMTAKSNDPHDRSAGTLDDEIYYGKKRLTGWAVSRVTFNSTSDAAPDIAVDADGKAHIAYRSGDPKAEGGDYEIKYATNRSGSWKNVRVTNDTKDDNFPTIAVNQGQVFIAWQKWDGGIWSSGDTEIFFRQRNISTGAWSAVQRLTNNSVNDMIPSIAAHEGKAQLVYLTENPDGEIIFRRQN